MLNRLKGVLPAQAYSTMSHSSFAPFPVDEHLHIEHSTSRELLEEPHKLVERLTTRLMRGFGVAERFFPYDDPKNIRERN